MILLIGHNRNKSNNSQQATGFTLIELILVMVVLTIVLGVAAPSLKDFFKGRNLDSEARRFYSLVTYGQSRAISEGIPMLLWIDAQRKSYGLQAATGYLDYDNKSVEYQLDPSLKMEVSLPFVTSGTAIRPPDRLIGNLPTIRFTPGGFISDTSPLRILIEQDQRDAVAVVQSTNHLRYDLQRFNPSGAWR